MTRIFPTLALFAVTFMVATMVLGLLLGDVRDAADTATQRWATVHRLSGVAAAIAVLFANGIAVTYFIGTSRWCKEVCETYPIDPALSRRAAALKRRAFPMALLNMLVVVGIVALGGAADPGASLQLQPVGGLSWADLHLAGAMAGIAFIAYTSFRQWTEIDQQGRVIADVLDAVRKVRIERGLDVEEPAEAGRA